MKNIKEFIKEIDKFKEFCVERAEHLAIIYGFGVSMTRGSYSNVKEIDEDSVLVEFQSYHYDPNYEYITLTIEQLEMSDEQWFKSLDKYREDFKLAQEKKKGDKIQKEIREAELMKEYYEKELKKLNENS